jgi:hypothetical protein
MRARSWTRGLVSILSAGGLLAACSASAPLPAASTDAAAQPSVTPGAVAFPSSVTPSPAASSPAPSALSTTVAFTSERYRYTVEVPRDWRQTPATTDWHGTDRLTDLSSALDRFDDNAAPGAEGQFLGIASQPVKGPSWLRTYTAANEEKFASTCAEEKHAWASTTIHGSPGVSFLLTCAGAFVENLFVDGDRAWIISGSPDAVETAIRTLKLGG